ncbi:MAG: hypothetical protein IPP13_17055 [Kouleothrix sp.]|nr:hypothetical protein [Kouleothrix sp.]
MPHYHARYYNPAIGRFVSADSMAPEYANPQDLNPYTYTHNNPVRYNCSFAKLGKRKMGFDLGQTLPLCDLLDHINTQ